METKEINENEIIQNLNTSFDESIKEGFTLIYLLSDGEKRFGGLTNDGQYKFTLYKDGSSKGDITFWENKVFSDFLGNDNTTKTWKNIKEELFEGFEYASTHNQLGGYGIENKSFSLDNINEIDKFFLKITQKETLNDVNNTLFYKK